MKRRWKILIGVIVIMLGFAAFWFVPKWGAVVAYRRMLLRQGEKLEIAEVLPPPVPPNQNGADTVLAAFRLLNNANDNISNLVPAMRLILPGKAIVCFKQPEVRDEEFTNSWSNEMAVEEDARPVRELLIKASRYPAIDFHLNYGDEMEMLLTNLSPLRECERRLVTGAVCSLHQDDDATAATNICVILALVNEERDERVALSQLVRMGMASDAACANWELLQSTNVNDLELATLQQSWERLEFLQSAENAIQMERACAEATIKRMRGSPEYFNHAATMGIRGPSNIWDNAKLTGTRLTWRFLWSYPDELLGLKGEQAILEALRSAQTNRSFYSSYTNMSAQLTALGIPDWGEEAYLLMDIDLPHLFSDDVPELASLLYRSTVEEATKRMVVTAIALKWYQLKNAKYPATLSDLTPEFLSSVPLDPVDGQPLRYRLKADGKFLLYSIGFNGKDDGGNPAGEKETAYDDYFWPTPHSLDWVWPQPSTPEEINNYYAHPAKEN